jgi:hypothetical protein
VLKLVAAAGRGVGAHSRGAHPSLSVQRLVQDSRAARELVEARYGLVRGGDSRHGHLGEELLAQKPVRRAECDALRPVPAAPNDTRVRGAGPPPKTFPSSKACKAPHPLQPIVRPRLRISGFSTRPSAQKLINPRRS